MSAKRKAPSGKRRPPAEGPAERRARATVVYKKLSREYPDAHCELDHASPYELIVATILSAQCTDKRVNMVTPALFSRYPNPGDLAKADRGELEKMIQSTGFFRNKAKSLLGMSNAVVEQHGGAVPSTMEELVTLPGVGRKTANVVLGNAFGINEGVVVDTHVARLSNRLGFTKQTDPVRIEQDLMPLFDREKWAMLSHLLIWHGRRVCFARKPNCEGCVVNKECPCAFVAGGRDSKAKDCP